MTPHFLVPGGGPIKCSHTKFPQKISKPRLAIRANMGRKVNNYRGHGVRKIRADKNSGGKCRRCWGLGKLRVQGSEGQKINCPPCKGTGLAKETT